MTPFDPVTPCASRRRPWKQGLALLALMGALSASQAQSLAPTANTASRDKAPTPSASADKDQRIRTQLGSRHAVTLSAEVSARLASLPLREGDAFRAGQTLASFDCSLYDSQRQKAEASIEAAQALVKSNQRLSELNAIGALEVQQAQARLKEAQAEAGSARLVVKRCAISAPFAGRVVKRHAAAHQFVSPGTPLLDIIDSGSLEVQMIVPSRWLAWLKPGSPFKVEVEELGTTVTAKVQRLGAKIDPVSQTVLVVGAIDGQPGSLLPGMSGWASFPGR